MAPMCAPDVGANYGWTYASQSAPSRTEVKTNGATAHQAVTPEYYVQPETFIWLELSMAEKVECVIVEREENGQQFSTVTIVNDNSPETRKAIYQREKAVIDAHPGVYFDFYVQARLNRQLSEFVGKPNSNTTVFTR